MVLNEDAVLSAEIKAAMFDTESHNQADVDALRAEMELLQEAADSAQAKLRMAVRARAASELQVKLLLQEVEELKSKANDAASPNVSDEGDRVGLVFEAVDDNGDGVLDLDEFREGYALLTGDAVAAAFNAMDSNGDGVLTKVEFQDGYALLTSDSARAAAERERVRVAVEAETVRAIKQAARNLAEAQLMDSLYGDPPPGETRWPAMYKPVAGRKPLRKRTPSEPYTQYGPLPEGFDAAGVRRLVAARVKAKASCEYEKADRLQEQLNAMGVRLDDRWRTWSAEVCLSVAKESYEEKKRAQARLRARYPRGRPSGQSMGTKGAVSEDADGRASTGQVAGARGARGSKHASKHDLKAPKARGA